MRQLRVWIRDVVRLDHPHEMIHDFATSTAYLESVKANVPHLYEKMQGVAKGAAVDLEQLFVYQSLDEFFLFLVASGTLEMGPTGHCAYGQVRKPNLVGRNNDIPTCHEEVVTVLHIKHTEPDLEILQSTLAGQIGQDDANVRGVAVDISMLANLPDGDGLPVSFSVRRILEAADVDEEVAYLKSARFAQAMNHLIGDRGRVVSVETWENNALMLDMYDGDYAMLANHSLGEGTPKTFEMTAEMSGGSHGFTMERLALGIELLSVHTEGVTLKSSPEMFKTRPIPVHPGKPMGRTLIYTVAEIPKEGSPALHGTPNSPNVFGHARFTFS